MKLKTIFKVQGTGCRVQGKFLHLVPCTLYSLIFLFLMPANLMGNPSNLSWAENVGVRIVPKNTQTYNVANYGAVPDGKTLNTKAIQQAIDDCAAKGGGQVVFAPGNYLTGSVYLKEGVHFIIPQGVTLLGSTDLKDYPEIQTRVAGIEMTWPSALINVMNQKNVMISGKGIIHGQGKVFWDTYQSLRKEYEAKGLRWIVDYDCKRPRMLLVSESSDITVKELTFRQPGFWTIQLLYSSHCTVDGVTIQNNLEGVGPSTDGIDIDSSSHILVENCDVDCNDDNFCLKAGRDADGIRVNRPTEYIVLRNCISRSGAGLLTCGSETSGGIRYVLADGLKARGTNVGVRLKSALNRGGATEHIYIRNVEMEKVGTIFEVNTNWYPEYSYSTLPAEYERETVPEHWKKILEKVPESKGIPYFRNIYLSNLKANNARSFMNAMGCKQSLLENFFFNNITAQAEKTGRISFAKNWKFSNIQLKTSDTQPLHITESQNVEFPGYNEYKNVHFVHQLKGKNQSSVILAAKHPEFTLLLPEMAGNLKFGLITENESKWLSRLNTSNCTKDGNRISYHLSDSLLKNGILTVEAIPLSATDGIVIEISGKNIPSGFRLFWSYGGASGKIPDTYETCSLHPIYCKDNVFSVEQTSFTVYYGESMRLKVIQGITPVSSEIRLSDTYAQDSPHAFFESGKKTNAPALTGILPLKNNRKEYFCVYKQSNQADYNHYMLPALFKQEK